MVWLENNEAYQSWCENHLCSVCQYSSWLIYKAGDILAYDVMIRFNIYSWMDICIVCTNKLNNNEMEFEEEDVRMEEDDVYTILNSFIDEGEGEGWIPMDIIWTPFGPGERVTAETLFFG